MKYNLLLSFNYSLHCGNSSGGIRCRENSKFSHGIYRAAISKKYDFQGKSARVRMIEILEDSEADIIAWLKPMDQRQISRKLLAITITDAKANLSIFSRYKLTDFGGLEGLSTFSHIQANARLSDELSVKVHCIWLTSGGRHIVAVKDEKLSEKEFIDGDNNRAGMIRSFLHHPEVKRHRK